MAAKLISDEYKYYDIIYNDTAECGVDIEYYLPDYCPDIQKVLKCCVSPNIENSSAVGDKITVSGNLGITVMYSDEKAASVRSCGKRAGGHIGPGSCHYSGSKCPGTCSLPQWRDSIGGRTALDAQSKRKYRPGF